MILSDFPELNFVRTLGERKKNKEAENFQKNAWPNVILNFKSSEAYRDNIKGPLSLFMNRSGKSYCSLNNQRYQIEDDYFFISNQDEYYTLAIEKNDEPEIFNIHFAEDFCKKYITAFASSNQTLLDNPDHIISAVPVFRNRLFRKRAVFNDIINNFYAVHKSYKNSDFLESFFGKILEELMSLNENEIHQVENLSLLKKSVRDEVFKRLSFARDFMISNYRKNISLDEVASAACLSKFHFIRLYKDVFKESPYHFIQFIRLEKAKKLLKKTNWGIREIAEDVGFEYHASLTRLFRKKLALSPTEYRLRKKSNIG